jgi:sterol 14-demethylase
VFFDNKHFGFAEGYAGLAEGFSVLFGPGSGGSKDKEENPKPPMDFSKYFNSRMLRVLRTDVLQQNLPTLIADTRARFGELAASAENSKVDRGFDITDPFESIYKTVFQLTMRTVGCNDIAEDLSLMSNLLRWYETVEKTTSPAAVMFPGLPTYAMLKRTVAAMKLFTSIKKIGDERVQMGKRGQDAMQILIDQGDEMSNIVGVSSSLFLLCN